jgi:hypothetical protein
MTWVFTADDRDGQQLGYQATLLLILICPVGRPEPIAAVTAETDTLPIMEPPPEIEAHPKPGVD